MGSSLHQNSVGVISVASDEVVVEHLRDKLRTELAGLTREQLIEEMVWFRVPGKYTKELDHACLVAIFTFLPMRALANAALVCKRWRDAANDPAIWRTAKIYGKKFQTGELDALLDRGIKTLLVGDCCGLPQPLFADDSVKEYQLRQLNIRPEISRSDLVVLLSRCFELETLYAKLSEPELDNKVCVRIGRNRNLRTVEIRTDCRGGGSPASKVTFAGLLAVARGCQKLVSLELGSLPVSTLSRSELSLLIDELPATLENFDLIFEQRAALGDEHIEALVSRCPRLKEVFLYDRDHVTDKSIEHLCRLEHLVSLVIGYCANIPSHSLRSLHAVKTLKYLELSDQAVDQAEGQLLTELLSNAKVTF